MLCSYLYGNSGCEHALLRSIRIPTTTPHKLDSPTFLCLESIENKNHASYQSLTIFALA